MQAMEGVQILQLNFLFWWMQALEGVQILQSDFLFLWTQLDLPILDGLHDSISGHSFSRIYTWQVTVTRPKPDAVVLLAKAETEAKDTRAGKQQDKFFSKKLPLWQDFKTRFY